MSLPQSMHPGYTLVDWKSWEGRWELINDVAYDMTPVPSTEHQEISMALSARIFTVLEEAKRKSGGGGYKFFAAPMDVYLESGVVQPDILVVCDAARISSRGIEGAPDLVVESPRTAEKDVTRMWRRHEGAGVWNT